MTGPRGKRINPFHHPDSGQVDYERLIATLRDCREQVYLLRTQCGTRNPLFREAEVLIVQIDAVATLSRVPDAMQRVIGESSAHSTSDMSGQ